MACLFSVRSDTGLSRRKNEDATLAMSLTLESGTTGMILAVADGMGGSYGGAVASRTAVDSVRDELAQSTETSEPTNGRKWLTMLRRAFARSVASLSEQVTRDEELTEMGTTLTTLVAANEKVTYAHIGDSRAYLFRDGQLRKLTTDHNVAQELADEGKIPNEETLTHRGRSVLTKWLAGNGVAIEPEVGVFNIQPDDLYLLCTDGLYTHVSENEIEVGMRGLPAETKQADLDRLAQDFVDRANARGGTDNISVVIGLYR